VNEATEANIEPEEFMGFDVLVDSTTGELSKLQCVRWQALFHGLFGQRLDRA